MTFPLIRHLSKPVTGVLARLPVSANQITAVSLLFGVACAWAMSMGDRAWDVIGGGFLMIAYVLDNCDGEIARLKNQCSQFGMRFDSFVDWAVHTAFFAALGMGVTASTGEDMWLWLGWIAAAGGTINYMVGFIVEARDRRVAAREGLTTKTGHEAPGETRRPETLYDWIIYGLRELSRADFCFIVLALALFDVAWVLLPTGAIGAQVYWILQFSKGAQDYHV